MTRTIIVLSSALVALPIAAVASQYPGWGDTGWVYASKRECCNAAIALAHQDSAVRCMEAGGRPSAFRGGRMRGSCAWEWMQDSDGAVLYHCQSEAQVFCR